MRSVIVAGALGILTCFPLVSAARTNGPVRMVAPQYQIQTSYAKRLVRAKLFQQTQHRNWSVTPVTNLRNRPVGPNIYFSAVPKGNPSMLSFSATVNPVKGRGVPTGVKRVTLAPQGCLIGPNGPLGGALRPAPAPMR